MFSKRHYEFMAHTIRQLTDYGTIGTTGEPSRQNEPFAETMARVLAAKFTGDNPRFNRDRFLKACGVQP